MRKLLLCILLLVGCSSASPVAEPPASAVVQPALEPVVRPQEAPAATPPSLTNAHFADANHGWVVVDRHRLEATTDGGATWSVRFESPQEVTDLHFADANRGWALFAGSDLHMTDDGGASWRPMASGARRAVQGLTGYDGTGPCQPHEAAPVALAPGWVMCGLYTGTGSMNKWLYHSADGGATWELRAASPEGLPRSGYVSQLAFVDETYGWFSAGMMAPIAGSSLHITTDGGRTWEEHRVGGLGLVGLTLLTRDHAFLVQQDYPAHRLLETRDGGVTWRFVR